MPFKHSRSATIRSVQVFRSLALVLTLLPPSFHLPTLCANDGQPRLVFDHKIGTDWKPDQNNWMSFVAVSSDGSTVAADGNVPNGQSGELGIWTFPSGNFLRSAPTPSLAISADFRYLATDASVLELKSAKAVVRTSRPGLAYTHAAFSPTGEYVALVESLHARKGEHGQITVLRTADGATAAIFGTRYTASLAFHPGGQILASGHWNNVTLWDSRRGAKLAVLFHGGPHTTGSGLGRDGRYIYGIGFSADGKLMAAGSDDGELQIWDVVTRKLLRSVNIGGGDVSNPAFSPDGMLLAAGTYGDGTISLLDVSWLAPKLALYLAMRDQQVNNSELARRLGVHERVVRRMLDPQHATKAERIQAALAALGKQMTVEVRDAA